MRYEKFIITPLIKTSYPQALTFLILLIALVGFFAMDIYFPSLPAISTAYNASPRTKQLTLLSFLLVMELPNLFIGHYLIILEEDLFSL